MKNLLLLVTFPALLASCATTQKEERPPIWKDRYGIIHREDVTVAEISEVVSVMDTPAVGCRRLRTIFIEGSQSQIFALKAETARMFGTHVQPRYTNPNGTTGYAWDCRNFKHIAAIEHIQRSLRHQALIEEKENRRVHMKQGYTLTNDIGEKKQSKFPNTGYKLKTFKYE